MTPSTDTDGAPRFTFELHKRNDIAWVILQGEADISTLGHLEAALSHIELDSAKSIHLHVTKLDFADVTTVRRLTDFAKRAKETGHDVKTCGARPTFRMLACLLEARDDLGLL